MDLYKPSELRRFLDELGIKPKKRFSQNFLIDGNIIRNICRLAGVTKGNAVLEIGPGPGALTEALLAAGAHVLAVEKDPQFATALERLQTADRRLSVVCSDILQFPLQEKLAPQTKVIANLPYSITTPILAQILPMRSHIASMTAMVQKEVGDRIVAKAGSANYSSLSLFTQFYASVEYGFTVAPTCFYPRPKVRSAVLRFLFKEHPPVSSEARFFQLTRTAFQQRRKMITSTLRELYPDVDIKAALIAAAISPEARPEDVSLDSFVRFFEIIEQKRQYI